MLISSSNPLLENNWKKKGRKREGNRQTIRKIFKLINGYPKCNYERMEYPWEVHEIRVSSKVFAFGTKHLELNPNM